MVHSCCFPMEIPHVLTSTNRSLPNTSWHYFFCSFWYKFIIKSRRSRMADFVWNIFTVSLTLMFIWLNHTPKKPLPTVRQNLASLIIIIIAILESGHQSSKSSTSTHARPSHKATKKEKRKNTEWQRQVSFRSNSFSKSTKNLHLDSTTTTNRLTNTLLNRRCVHTSTSGPLFNCNFPVTHIFK